LEQGKQQQMKGLGCCEEKQHEFFLFSFLLLLLLLLLFWCRLGLGCRKFDGTYDSIKQNTRTSHNTWCVEECYQDERNQNVIKRVENITGIPDTNSEYWQFLQYEVGQFYAVSISTHVKNMN
jgi:hypothetical protein